MARGTNARGSGIARAQVGREPTKQELQHRMEETRESLSQTVEQLKDTVAGQVESVKDTVSGVLDYREQLLKEPLIWSLGTLSAGFALGYTLGYAHKDTRSSKNKSKITAFADSIVDELGTVGQSLLMPALNTRIRELFGFDFSELLDEIGGAKKQTPKRIGAGKRPVKRSAKKGSRRKQ
jgi:hypothetical protein